jgi:hypothetical protein
MAVANSNFIKLPTSFSYQRFQAFYPLGRMEKNVRPAGLFRYDLSFVPLIPATL